MMKRILAICFVFICAQQIGAQGIFTKERLLNRENHDKQRFRWGYYLGFNSLDFKIDYTADRINTLADGVTPTSPDTQDIVTNKALGFNVGLIGNLRINDYLDLRTEPGVIFNTRELFFPNLGPQNSDQIREVQTTAVHIPLLLKLSTKRLNNFKPFVVGGVSASINLSSNEKNPDDNSSGQFRTATNFYSYELGFGIDFFLPYFKFTPSIRGVFSTTDEIIQDEDPNSNYTKQIDKLSTRGVFINFTFQ
nr:porin family protein [Aquimarina agarivorans]